MANINQDKPAHRWNENELRAFNIRLVMQKPEEFFGRNMPNLLDIDADLYSKGGPKIK